MIHLYSASIRIISHSKLAGRIIFHLVITTIHMLQYVAPSLRRMPTKTIIVFCPHTIEFLHRWMANDETRQDKAIQPNHCLCRRRRRCRHRRRCRCCHCSHRRRYCPNTDTHLLAIYLYGTWFAFFQTNKCRCKSTNYFKNSPCITSTAAAL